MKFDLIVNELDKTPYALLNVDDLSIKDGERPSKESLKFALTIYKTLTGHSKNTKLDEDILDLNLPADWSGEVTHEMEIAWTRIVGLPNKFFATLTNDEQGEIMKFFIHAHYELHNFFKDRVIELSGIDELMYKIGIMLDKLDMSIGLCDKIHKFIEDGCVPIYILPGAGSRAQDSPELTFAMDELTDLTTIAMLCKILSPIFSTAISLLSREIFKDYREQHTQIILSPLITRKYLALYEKLHNYIHHTIEQNMMRDPEKDETDRELGKLMHGYDSESLTDLKIAGILTRRFVNINLNRRQSSIMTFILMAVKRSKDSDYTPVNKYPTMTRKILQAQHGDDQGNESQLETDSLASSKMASVDALIRCSVPYILDKKTEEFEIPRSDLSEIINEYAVGAGNTVPVQTHFNLRLLAVLFSSDIGGGESLRALHADQYMQLVALAQLIVLSISDRYRILAHMASMKPGEIRGRGIISDMGVVLTQMKSSLEYANCRSRSASLFDSKKNLWDTYMDDIYDHLRETNYLYNTAPSIWEWMNLPIANNTGVYIPPKALAYYCHLYDFIARTEGSTL